MKTKLLFYQIIDFFVGTSNQFGYTPDNGWNYPQWKTGTGQGWTGQNVVPPVVNSVPQPNFDLIGSTSV